MTQMSVFHRTYFLFPNALWASASGGFRIVSDALVIGKTGKTLFCRTSVKSGTAAALLSVLMVPLMIDDDDDLHSTPRYGGPRRYNAICHDVWYDKTRMVWLSNSEKNEDMFICFDTIHERDGNRQTYTA